MNKRILSMLLALCMVLVALPVFALAVVAADSEEATVNISFCLPDGTEVCTRKVTPGVANFELPTNEEIEAALNTYNAKDGIKGKYELTKDDILGFYDVSIQNVMADAAAYRGALVNKDKSFYAITTKATFKPDMNWPVWTPNASFDCYRGGWSVGYYSKSTQTISTYTYFDAANNILNAGNTWSTGGLYLPVNPNYQSNMVTCADNSTVMVWRAIAPGTVSVDFEYLGFLFSNFPDPVGGKSDIAVAIAKNDVIVWPKAAAGKTISETWETAGSGTDNTWFYTQLEGKTGDMTAAYKKYCTDNDDTLSALSVAAGDNIQFVFKKVVAAGITAYPIVNYTEVTGEVDPEAAGIVTKFESVYETSFDSNINYPTYATPATGSELTFKGNWDFVQYTGSVWGDASRAQINRLANVSGTSVTDAFYVAGTFSGTVWTDIIGMRVPSGDTPWGSSGAITVSPNYKVGYRYTAEYTGLVNISVGDYFRYSGADAALGIFVNGQMVWPKQGDYYADLTQWATITSTKQTPTDLPQDVLVAKGDMIEVLVAGNDRTRGVEVKPVNITYSMLYTDLGITTAGKQQDDGTYDLALTVDLGGMDNVKVEAADAQGAYREITAVNGVYTVEGYSMKEYVTGAAAFRFTVSVGGKTSAPQYVNFTIPSRYTVLHQSSFGADKNIPTVSGNNVTYTGNWDFMVYTSVSEVGTAAGKVANTAFSNNAAYIADAVYTVGSEDFKSGFSFSSSAEWGGSGYGMMVRNGAAASYRYTAEKSGLAYIALDKVGHTSSNWKSDVAYGIFVNGEKIWPTADTTIEGLTFTDGWLRITTTSETEKLLTDAQLAAVNEQLKNVYLRKGDALEFVCYAPGTSTPWTNCGNVCYASVYYGAYEEAELPTVETVSAVMGTDFGFVLNCANNNPQVAELLATATIGNRDLTVTVNGNTVRITGIRATEMTDTITYRVYARSTNGTVATSRLVGEATTTYADLLAGYLVEGTDVKVKDMAIATLKYGAAAQTRFLYRTDDLATRVLGEGDTLSFTVPTAANEYAQTSAATNYRFAGASFLLNEKIQLKLFIDLQAGQEALNETLYLEIAEGDGGFKRSDAKISQRAVSDPSNAYLKAVLDLNPTANATVYRFRLVNEAGDVVSTELTYSVATYAYSAVEDKALTDAILAFGQAARNYNNV